MKLRRTSALVVLVLASSVLAGCINTPKSLRGGNLRPAPLPGLWQVPAGCITGAQTTVGNGAKGSVQVQTEFCWDSSGESQRVNSITASCLPAAGWTAIRQVVKDNLFKYQAWATCQFTKPGKPVYEVINKHSWATKDRYQAYRQGCSSANEDLITDCSSENPVRWQTWGFEDQLLDLRPPAPPQSRRWLQGKVVGWSDTRARSTQVSFRGSNLAIGSDGSFSADLPQDWPHQYRLHITPASGFTARWTACSNNTSCHSSRTPQPFTADLTVDPEPGKYLDVRFYLDAVPSTVQGFRLLGQNNGSYTDPFVRSQNVYIDGEPANHSGSDSSYSKSISEGGHTVSVDVPSGWTVGYTLCYNATNCHNNAPTMSSSVWINAPLGGFVDLWWHYYQNAKVQGFKMKGQDVSTRSDPLIRQQDVYVDGQPQWFRPDFGYEAGVTPGQHTVSVEVPPGWSVKYTLCFDWTGCHNFLPIAGSSVTFNVAAGSFIDLWWHYYPN